MITRLAIEFNLDLNTQNRIFLAKSGGGNHATEMFKILRTSQPKLTTKTLHENLINCGYTKAAADIKEVSDKKFLSDIKPSDLIKLCNELLNEGIDFPRVTDLAKSLGMNGPQIYSIKKAQQAMDCYSYIELLLKYLSQEQPEVTVERFMEALYKINNQSAFQLFADLVNEHASYVQE